MARGPAPPVLPPAEPLPQKERDEYDAFIEERLRRTRRQVKVVDIAAGLLTLATGTLIYLLVAAVLDHWLIAGGLGFFGRLMMLLGLLVGAGYYLAVYVVPPLLYRINPLFAAQAIERHRPSLKNGLVNLLFLRRDRQNLGRDQLAKRIYRGMEEKAAAELADPSVEMAVDRSGIIRLGYLLAVVLAICCLYVAISPKSPLVSFRRVVWPWADIPAPTRVTISEIEPGDAVAFQGDTLTVSAEVRGIEPDEPVMLYFTTADGQSVDQAIPMSVPSGGYRYHGQIPPGSLGLQQDLEYYLAAGDAKSKRFHVKVEIPLAILVDKVHYDYPAYTGIPDRTASSGDLRAIEGTKVQIEATANKPIRRAAIELDCDPRNVVPMIAKQTRATGQLTLRMDPKDPARPQLDSYQLRFRDAEDRYNPRPIRHQVDVIPDLPPDIRLVDPPEDKIQLPLNGSLELKVRAEDPDFALRRIAVRAERGGRSLAVEPLLDRPRPEQPYQGTFEATYRLEPSKLKLQVGDEVSYWAEADDNKEPVANHSETPRRTIVVVAPPAEGEPREQGGPGERQPENGGEKQQAKPGEQPQEPPGERAGKQPMPNQPDNQQQPQADQKQQQDQQPQEPQEQQKGEQGQQQGGGAGPGDDSQQKQDAGQEGGKQQDQQPQEGQQQGQGKEGQGQQAQEQQGQGQNSEGQNGESQEGKAQPGGAQQSGQSSGTPQDPVDGQINPGEAIERILQHRREQQQGQGQGQNPSPKQPDGAKPGQQQASPGQQGSGDANRPQQPGGEQPAGEPPSGQQAQDGMKPGNSGKQGAKEQKAPDNQPGGGRAAEDRKPQDGQGAQSGGGGKPDQKKEPKATEGEQRPDAQGGDPQSPQGDPGAGKPSNDNQGTPSPQEANQDREKKPADKKPGEQPSDQQADSPTTSPKQSDSQGDEAGDRSGGGGKGGGQQADQPGTGNPGSNTPAEQGGQPSGQQGKGETGSQGGDQTKADQPTGKPGSESGEAGSSGKQQPGGQDGGQRGDQKPSPQQPGQPSGDPGQTQQPSGGQPGGQQPSSKSPSTAGNPDRGGMPGQQSDPDTPPQSGPLGADDPNLKYANEQTELALEHLKNQLDKENSDVLDRLGWDRKQAENFLRNWEKMERDAAQPGDSGQAARKELNNALRSLGLSPHSTQLKSDGAGSDQLRNLRENRRFDPPAEWADLFRAYTKGLGEGTRPPASKAPGSQPRRTQAP